MALAVGLAGGAEFQPSVCLDWIINTSCFLSISACAVHIVGSQINVLGGHYPLGARLGIMNLVLLQPLDINCVSPATSLGLCFSQL